MHLLIDNNIPIPDDAFDGLAEVRRVDGREFTPQNVGNADALLIRSVTRVDAKLLEGSKVQFVATATIGVDHCDVGYLRSRGIAFASAPGSNADAVADYFVAAMLVMAERFGLKLAGMSVGVVGIGNVGSRVVARAKALGLTVLMNDPPLARTGQSGLLPLGDLMQADVISLHVPLTVGGDDATRHLFDAHRIGSMKPGALLLNTSRGAVVDTAALIAALRRGHLRATVLDVWEHEPDIDRTALRLAAIATPHIAGHSVEGKRNGAYMVYRAACRHFGWNEQWDGTLELGEVAVNLPQEPSAAYVDQELFGAVVRQVYPIEDDDAKFRSVMLREGGGDPFAEFRLAYKQRREFSSATLRLPPGSEDLGRQLAGIGFRPSIDTKPRP